MAKALRLIIFLSVALAIIVLPACAGGTSKDKNVVSGTGTVKFINLEGGFYGIAGDDGKN